MTLGWHFASFGLLTWAGLAVAADSFAQPSPIIRQALLPQLPAVAAPTALPQPASGAVPSRIEKLPEPHNLLNADQLDGLRMAEKILETANHEEAATELRHKILELELEQLKQLLAEKTKALAQLQAEVNALRAPNNSTQVTLSFQVLELSRTKLRNLGFELNSLDGDFDFLANTHDRAPHVVEDSAKVDGLIDTLRKNNLIRVLAEPTLVTMSGRPAMFHCGGELPRPSGLEDAAASNNRSEFGTFIDAIPLLQEDGRLRLEFRVRVTDIDQELSKTDGKQTLPGFRTKEVDTAVVLRSGQTLVMCGIPQTRIEEIKRPNEEVEREVHEIETLFLVRPTYQVSQKRN